VTDLERIGDLGVNICERVLELNGEPPLKPYVDMPNMAREAQEMLHEGLDAFVAADVERAQHVIARDRNVDAYYTADLPRAAHLHDGGSAQHLPRDPPAVDRQVPGTHRRPRDQRGRAGRLHGQGQGHPPTSASSPTPATRRRANRLRSARFLLGGCGGRGHLPGLRSKLGIPSAANDQTAA
jgi:hypothetical protein